MPVKFTREDFRESGSPPLRRSRLTRRKTPRGSRFQMFLFLYIGVGAYIVIALFLQNIMEALGPVDQAARGVVIEKFTEEDVPVLRLEVTLDTGESFMAEIVVGETLYREVEPGTTLEVQFREGLEASDRRITGVRLDPSETGLSTEEGNERLFETIPLR